MSAIKKISINNSYIQRLEVSHELPFAARPSINNSIVEVATVDCEYDSAIESVLRDSFPSCTIEELEFDQSAGSKLSKLSPRSLVLFNVFRKTYRQSVKGRMESALKAGIGREKSDLVDEVVAALERGKFLRKERVQSASRWHPNKEMRELVEDFLRHPTDPKADQLLNTA